MQRLHVAVRGPKDLDWLKTGPGGKEMGFCKGQNVPNTCNGMKGHTQVCSASKAPKGFSALLQKALVKAHNLNFFPSLHIMQRGL